MANAKEYKDLTEATSIDNNAQVALAQPNETELQTTTVTNLAEKVQEINTDGPLAELELATSIGKQQLAEALTEKGAASTPSDTLVQMADKLRGLTVNDSTEDILSSYELSVMAKDTDIGGFIYPNFMRHPLTGDMIITYGSMIYYIPYSEDYRSFTEILAGASFSFDLSTINASYTTSYTTAMACVSEDFSKLLVTVDDTNTTHLIFNVGASEFTLLHTVSYQFSTSNNNACSVSNDGNIIASARYDTLSRGFVLYNVSTNVYTWYSNNNLGNATGLRSILLKNSKVYAYFSSSGTPSYVACMSVAYTVSSEDGSIKFTSPQISNGQYLSNYSTCAAGYFWLHRPGQADEPLFIARSSAVTQVSSSSRAYTPSHYAQIVYNFKYIQGSNSQYIQSYTVLRGTSTPQLQLWVLRAATISWEANRYVFNLPGLPTMYYDPETNKETWDDENNTKAVHISASTTGMGLYVGLYSSMKTGVVITTSSYDFNNRIGTTYKGIYTTKDSSRLVLAKRRTINGSTAYFDPILSNSDITNPGYIQDTASVPLPEDQTN